MTTHDWKTRIASAAQRAGEDLDSDVIEELAQHAASTFQAARARGESEEAADATVTALIAIWVAEARTLRRTSVAMSPTPPPSADGLLRGIGRDARYGVRLLFRQRGFTFVALMTIALAISVTTTLFSVIDAVLLRPLPWPEADRLVRLTETHAGATRRIGVAMTNTGYLPLTESPLSTIDAVGGWSSSSVTLTTNGDAVRIQTARVTSSLFHLLRATPLHGRSFSSDEAAEVVISYGFWIDQFGSALEAVGRTLKINGQDVTVVGVMPASFMFPNRETRLWRPLAVPTAGFAVINVMARLRPAATVEQTAAEATTRARTVSVHPNGLLMAFGTSGPAEIIAQPALDAITGDVRPALIALFVAVSLLLVTAVANIANLQLARATARYREMAIRAALGAGRGRLVRQLVVEQLLMAICGGLLGVFISLGLHQALPTLLPADFPRLSDIGLRPTVIVFAFALSALTGLVLGVLPAMHLPRMRLAQTLTEAAAAGFSGSRRGLRMAIMIGQITVACTLLVGALLLGRSFVAMLMQDRGFQSAQLVTARVNLPGSSTNQARIDATEELVARISAMPGAQAVAVTTGLPLSGSENLSGFDMPSVRPPVGTSINVHAVRSVVTPGYLRALGLRLVAGRDFNDQDDSVAGPKVVIVNRTFASQYLTDVAVGDHIRNFMNGDGVDFEVIGVVADMRRGGLLDQIQPEIYSLLRQSPRPATTQDLIIRTSSPAELVVGPVRQLVRQVEPDATVDAVRTMEDRILGSLSRPRLYTVLLIAFASAALVIACIGLVSVLSYVVAQRTREIALRMALGARPAQVLWLVLVQGLIVTVTGIGLGLVVSFESARYLSSLLYGVTQYDRLSFVVAPFALAVVAISACLVPALRAVRIAPLEALRS